MPTKGIQFYVYISNPAISVNITIGTECNQTYNFIPASPSNPIASFVLQPGSFEIGSTTYGIMSENFICTVKQANNPNSLFTLQQSMSPLTGAVGNSSTDDLWNMLNTPSQIVQGNNASFAISYGFYQAGIGDQHQFYIYVTDVYTTWMSDLMSLYTKHNPNTPIPFCSFILPGAHDSGMCNNSYVSNLTSASQNFQSICNNYGLPINDSIFTTQLVLQSITNFAFTQKDTITMMLNLGIRFFDFRPGFNYVSTDNTISGIYHQHNCIPGYSFVSFLTEIIDWLNTTTNEGEIVVVYLNYNGFASDSMQPAGILEDFFNPTNPNGITSLLAGGNLQIGGASCLGNSYQSLKALNTRLIFVNNLVNTNIPIFPNTSYLDSYTDAAYETNEVEPIINQLTITINTAKTSQNINVLLQLQGTIIGTLSGKINAVSYSASSSPLMSTKPGYDLLTYSFLEQQSQSGSFGLLPSNPNNNFYACINDYADNALVSNCINMTTTVLNLQP